jgi:DNA-binding MarR family transcriptional regulator
MAKINDAQIWALNYRILTNVITDASSDIAKLGLEIKEFFVLADIDECPHPVGLAVRLSMPKPTITVYLKSLEAHGFVRRKIDRSDLRRHVLILTPAGRKAVTRARNILSKTFGIKLARLNISERNELQRLLEKLAAT